MKKARALEIERYRKMNVYEKRPSEKCFEKTKKPPTKVKWTDHNTGRQTKRERGIEARAKQISTRKEEGLFAAAPPLEALRHPQNAAHAEVLEQDMALSSAEAELGAVKASQEVLGMMSLWKDVSETTSGHVVGDASAAIGII